MEPRFINVYSTYNPWPWHQQHNKNDIKRMDTRLLS